MATPFVDMELDDADKVDFSMPIAGTADKDIPQYPWGLRITLTERDLEKLGIDIKDMFVGGVVHGHFLARITCQSVSDGPNGACERSEMQIEDLSLESEDAENEEAE